MLRGLIYLFCCLQILICSNDIFGDVKIGDRSDQCAAVRWAPPLNGKKLIPIALSSEKTRDIKDCVLKCFTTDGCVALNFGPRKGKHCVCELLRTDRHFLFSNFTDTSVWTYVEKQVWNFETLNRDKNGEILWCFGIFYVLDKKENSLLLLFKKKIIKNCLQSLRFYTMNIWQ